MKATQTESRPSYWALLEFKLQQNPALLVVALNTIDRWLAQDHSAPHRLLQWRELIVAAQKGRDAFSALLHILTSDAPADARLRDFSPFCGILTREERRTTRELCGYRH